MLRQPPQRSTRDYENESLIHLWTLSRLNRVDSYGVFVAQWQSVYMNWCVYQSVSVETSSRLGNWCSLVIYNYPVVDRPCVRSYYCHVIRLYDLTVSPDQSDQGNCKGPHSLPLYSTMPEVWKELPGLKLVFHPTQQWTTHLRSYLADFQTFSRPFYRAAILILLPNDSGY